MNPSTGTFTTMDTYQGSIFDPVSLHKYLYANANPVTYSDPTGNFADAKSFIAGFNVSTILEAGAAIAGACVMAIGRNVISKLRVGAAFSLVSHTVANVLEDIHYIELIQQGYVNLAALYMIDQVSINGIKILQDAFDKLNECLSENSNVVLNKKSKTKTSTQTRKRSSSPPARRIRCRSKKEAYERAKRAGHGREPIHHANDPNGPHYHPDVPNSQRSTPHQPCSHDHYFY